MIEYSNILAVVEPERENQPAISRAIELAEKTGASITALMTIYDFSYEMTTMLSGEEREAMRQAVVNERTAWLKDQLAEYGQPIEAAVEWNNRPYEAIIKYALASKADIVVKATRSHDDLRSVIFTPTDWHLVRKCPAPVLLVKEHDWPRDGKIVAAVNVGTEDREHAQLNDRLTNIALDYARLLSGKSRKSHILSDKLRPMT